MSPKPIFDRSEFEERARALVGKRLVRVLYYAVDYDNYTYDEPAWSEDARFDILDDGIDLVLEDTTCYIEAIGPYPGFKIEWNPDHSSQTYTIWDVTKSDRWQNLIGQNISDARVLWTYWFNLFRPSEIEDWPYELVLTMEAGQHLFITARDEISRHVPICWDNLKVISDQKVAEGFQVGTESFDPEDPDQLITEAELWLNMSDEDSGTRSSRIANALELISRARNKNANDDELRLLKGRIENLVDRLTKSNDQLWELSTEYNLEQFPDEHEMLNRWLSMSEQGKSTQRDVDAFIARLNSGVEDHGSYWLKICLQFRAWARSQGFSVQELKW